MNDIKRKSAKNPILGRNQRTNKRLVLVGLLLDYGVHRINFIFIPTQLHAQHNYPSPPAYSPFQLQSADAPTRFCDTVIQQRAGKSVKKGTESSAKILSPTYLTATGIKNTLK
jgi:hypothetical protein